MSFHPPGLMLRQSETLWSGLSVKVVKVSSGWNLIRDKRCYYPECITWTSDRLTWTYWVFAVWRTTRWHSSLKPTTWCRTFLQNPSPTRPELSQPQRTVLHSGTALTLRQINCLTFDRLKLCCHYLMCAGVFFFLLQMVNLYWCETPYL